MYCTCTAPLSPRKGRLRSFRDDDDDDDEGAVHPPLIKRNNSYIRNRE